MNECRYIGKVNKFSHLIDLISMDLGIVGAKELT